MAIDFGLSHLGVAIGYTENGLVSPLAVIDNTSLALSKLAGIIGQHNPRRLIVGVSEKESAAAAMDFANLVSKLLKIPTSTIDETLTSQEAATLTRHIPPRRRWKISHAAAAAIILERWLDEQRGNTL